MQDIPNREDDEKPMMTFLRYVNVLLFGYKGEEESYTISYRTKSAVDTKSKKTTYSYRGNKWGKQFKDLKGENKSISQEELEKMRSFIRRKIKYFESNGEKGYFDSIIKDVAKKFGLRVSKPYLSGIKNE